MDKALEFDSASIDSDHRGLVQLGYRFITNIRDMVEERADTVIWVKNNYGQETACLIHDNAYSPVDGGRLQNYASVWIKRAK